MCFRNPANSYIEKVFGGWSYLRALINKCAWSHALKMVFAFVATVFVGCGAALAQAYDLRGIRLGVTLEQFRGLAYPDGGKAAFIMCHKQPGADAEIKLLPIETERAGGAIGCAYYKSERLSPGSPHFTAPAYLKVATVSVDPVFWFAPDQRNVTRLYAISFRSHVNNWHTFWEGYTGRYGQPKNIKRDPIQNRMGATFDNIDASWVNEESKIFAYKRFANIDTSYFRYELTALSDYVQQKGRKVKGSPKDNL